jgi:thiol-disulfide isomerase/thioredoxin
MSRNRVVATFITLVALAHLAWAGQTNSPPASAGQQGGVAWSQSYEVGLNVARMQQLPLLVFFTASWCPWCHKLEQEVLTQPRVLQELRKFICVKLDAEKSRDVAMAFGVVSLPRIVVVNTHGEIIGDWLGYRDANEFLDLVADVLPYATTAAGVRKAPSILPPAKAPHNNSPPVSTVPPAPAQLTDLLGHKEPKIRQNAANILVKGGPAVLPVMVDALEHEYLGVRIAAWKIIRTLSGTDLDFDPWAPLAERTEAIKRLHRQIEKPPQPAPATEATTR